MVMNNFAQKRDFILQDKPEFFDIKPVNGGDAYE